MPYPKDAAFFVVIFKSHGCSICSRWIVNLVNVETREPRERPQMEFVTLFS